MEGSSNERKSRDAIFHIFHKVPAGDGPYSQAKHLQGCSSYHCHGPSDSDRGRRFPHPHGLALVEKDPEAAILWFWKAINDGDRVDSALKDMAVLMNQQDRAEEAVEAIKSFRHLCSKHSQDSIDNILIDLYKKSGRIDEQIMLIKHKLWKIYRGEAFNGKTTKTARSHGKKFQVSVKQETSRLLGNLGWGYMQQANYVAAEAVYRKAQMIDPDTNKACNLALSLIRQGRSEEARYMLLDVMNHRFPGSDDSRTMKRAEELLLETEIELKLELSVSTIMDKSLEEEMVERLDLLINEWKPFRSTRLPVFEEISSFRDEMAC